MKKLGLSTLLVLVSIHSYGDIEGQSYNVGYYSCSQDPLTFEGGFNEATGTLTVVGKAVKMTCSKTPKSKAMSDFARSTYSQAGVYCSGKLKGADVLLVMTNSMGSIQAHALRTENGSRATLNCEPKAKPKSGGWN